MFFFFLFFVFCFLFVFIVYLFTIIIFILSFLFLFLFFDKLLKILFSLFFGSDEYIMVCKMFLKVYKTI